jgi:hypothetical protein
MYICILYILYTVLVGGWGGGGLVGWLVGGWVGWLVGWLCSINSTDFN